MGLLSGRARSCTGVNLQKLQLFDTEIGFSENEGNHI